MLRAPRALTIRIDRGCSGGAGAKPRGPCGAGRIVVLMGHSSVLTVA